MASCLAGFSSAQVLWVQRICSPVAKASSPVRAYLRQPIGSSRADLGSQRQVHYRQRRAVHAEPEQAQVIPTELVDSMREKIREALATQDVDITDTYGDGRHVSIEVISEAFEGLSSVARQRMVYKAIWMELQSAVHAVDALVTRTPAEAGK